MKEIIQTNVSEFRLSRRRFLNLATLAGASGLLAACGGTKAQTPTREASITLPTAEALQRDNFAQIKEARIGQIITIKNYVIQGFVHASTRKAPLIGPLIEERFAYTFRQLNARPQERRYSGLLMGADCLIDYANSRGILNGAIETTSSTIDASVKFVTPKTGIVLEEVVGLVGFEIPNSEGAKIIHLASYTAKGESRVLCVAHERDIPDMAILVDGINKAEERRK
jgi:hypothetical protein